MVLEFVSYGNPFPWDQTLGEILFMLNECQHRFQTLLACSAQSSEMLPPPKKKKLSAVRQNKKALKEKVNRAFEE